MFRHWSRRWCGGQGLDLKGSRGGGGVNWYFKKKSVGILQASCQLHDEQCHLGVRRKFHGLGKCTCSTWPKSGSVQGKKNWGPGTISHTVWLETHLPHDLPPIEKNLVSFPEAISRCTGLLTCKIHSTEHFSKKIKRTSGSLFFLHSS